MRLHRWTVWSGHENAFELEGIEVAVHRIVLVLVLVLVHVPAPVPVPVPV